MVGNVVVATYNYRHEAELARGYLEANGIAAIVVADDCGAEYPCLEFGSGTQLMVGESDRDRAMDLLRKAREKDATPR